MNFSHNFRRDLDAIDWFSSEPFALVRFADGERAILDERDIATADGWQIPVGSFADSLRGSIRFINEEPHSRHWHVGISCQCCDAEAHRFYLEEIDPQHYARLTFSNIFANANWDAFLTKCIASPPRSVGWVGPYPLDGLPVFLYPVAWIPQNLVNDPMWSHKIGRIVDKMIFEAAHGPIFVAGGPAAKIIIHRYWRTSVWPPGDCSRKTVIDVGSALDPVILGRDTRGYHDTGHPNRKRACVWGGS